MPQSGPNHRFVLIAVLVGSFAALSYAHDALEWSIRDSDFDDFGTYYFSAYLLTSGVDYGSLDQEGIERLKREKGVPASSPVAAKRFGNAPLWIGLLSPVTWLDYTAASRLWVLLVNLCLAAAILLLVAGRGATSVDWGFILFMVFSFQPLYENVVLGQTDLPMLALMSLGVWAAARGRGSLSGACWSMAAFVKPQFGLILVFLLFAREYKAFFWAAATFAVLKVASVFWLGWEIQALYLDELLSAVGGRTGSYTANLHNLSLLAATHRLLPALSQSIPGRALLYAVLAGIAVCAIRGLRPGSGSIGRPTGMLHLGMVMVASLICSPLTQEHHFVVLYVPFVLLWFDLRADMRAHDAVLFAVAYLLLGLEYSLIGFGAFHSGIPSLLYNGKLAGLAVLFVLLARRSARASVPDGKPA